MSLFLGKIHFWMYDKILWYEGIEREIIEWADKKGLPAESWEAQISESYGEGTGGRPLETIIDQANIHGWLQEKISAAEARQAALVTMILNENPDSINDLLKIYEKNGESTARSIGDDANSPEEIYNLLNNFILEGMPCDRVVEQLSSTSEEYVWKLGRCLHRQYWDSVNGDAENFYILRGAWIKSFTEALNPDFTYERAEDNTHRIISKQRGV